MGSQRIGELARAIAEVCAPLVIARAALVVVVFTAVTLLPLQQERCLDCAPSGIAWLDAWARWDGRWYVSVAESGYGDRPGEQSNLAYFPLYPIAMRLVAAPFGGDRVALVTAGLAVSQLALLAALIYLVRLARLDADVASARRAALYALAFPTTIFLSTVYAESLFLALAVAAFWYARQDRWALAGVLSGLAALTRPFGLIVALGLVAELVTRNAQARAHLGRWAWLSLAPLALVGWIGYLFVLTGRPLAVLEAHAAWSVRPTELLRGFVDLSDPAVYGFPWAVIALLLVTAVLSAYAWRLRRSYGVYSLLVFAAAVSPGTLTSSMRHELGLFPAFIVLGMLGARRSVHWSYLLIGGAASMLFGAMFALSHWIG